MPQPCAILLVIAAWPTLLTSLQTTVVEASDSQQHAVTVSNGQALADALAQFGATGQDSVILLTPQAPALSPADTAANASSSELLQVISLQGVQFNNPTLGPNGGPPFSSGTVIVSGGPQGAVLDASMCAGMTTMLSGTAVLELVNLTLVNLCEISVPLNPQSTLWYTTALSVGLFPRSRAYQSQTYTNVTFYVRPGDVQQHIYGPLVQVSPFPAVREAAAPWFVSTSDSHLAVQSLTMHSMSCSFSLPAAQYDRTTLVAVDKPHDPLLDALRAAGRLEQPLYCNNSQPVNISTVGLVEGALHLVDNDQLLLQALADAASVAARRVAEQRPPPAVVLLYDVHWAAGLLPSRWDVPGPIMLVGPFFTEANASHPVTVDFQQRSDVIRLQQGAQLFLQQLVVSGLQQQFLPGSTSALPSALPLAAISSAAGPDTWASAPLVHMHACVLLLPVADYLALLMLALEGTPGSISSCVDGTIAQHAARLNASINTLQVDDVHSAREYMVLAKLQGWGISATALWVRPATDLDAAVSSCLAANSARGSSSSSSMASNSQKGWVVGLACGMAVLGLLLVAGGAFLWSRRQGLQQLLVRRSSSLHKQRGSMLSQASLTDGLDPNKPSTRLLRLLQQHAEQHASLGRHSEAGSAGSAQLTSIQLSVRSVLLPPGESHPWGAGAGLHVPPAHLPGSGLQSAAADAAAANPADPAWRPGGRLDGEVAGALTASTGSLRVLGSSSGPAQQADGALGPGWAAGAASLSTDADAGCVTSSELGPLTELTCSKATGDEDDGHKLLVFGVLGSGTYGTVFAGEWRGLKVAIKTMVFEMPPDEQLGSTASAEAGAGLQGEGVSRPLLNHPVRPVMEAAISASVGHRNLVSTYCYDIKPVQAAAVPNVPGNLHVEEAFRHKGSQLFKLFLVQELCDLSLATALRARAIPLPATRESSHLIMHLLLDVAVGLQYLHARNIVHGDLKPDNIMLKQDVTMPYQVVAKLTDFGLSSHLQEGASHLSLLCVAGTPGYIAPEVLQHKRVSPAADMYALGVIIWEVCAGQPPYWLGPRGELLANPMFGRLPPGRPPPDHTLLDLQLRCLAADPAARPSALLACSVLHGALAPLQGQDLPEPHLPACMSEL